MALKNIDTPCIGICSTIYGDKICRGCKRTYQEVIDWNVYDSADKQTIYQRLQQQIVAACQDKIAVVDAKLLQQKLTKFNIRHRADEDPLCWAFYLLREGHNKIKDINNYGIKILSKINADDFSELYAQIDAEILRTAQHS